jgi:dihydroorotase/N-acyl-D-amino-acid deacylase
MHTILFENGSLVDGTGAPAARGSVLVRGNRIAEVGQLQPPAECRRIDCAGLTLAPGFIDIHSHSDVQVLAGRREKADQGVTTEVVGNCGFSPYPCGAVRQQLHDYAQPILMGAADWGWKSAKDYLKAVAANSHLIGVLSLVGHGSLRVAVAGHRQGALSKTGMDTAEQTLSDCLSEGAAGFSTGLMYAPGSSAPAQELARLCKVVARHGKVYATHMRSYAWQLLEAVDEQIQLARESGCRLEISHLQAVGRANWHKQEQALEKIEKARQEGVDVGFDIYPYLAGSTMLTQFLPQSALVKGVDGMVALLKDVEKRKRMAAEVRQMTAQQWTDVFITSVATAANQPLVGKNIGQIAGMRKQDPVETLMDLLIEENGAIIIVSFNQSEENLRKLLTHPLCSVGSDGFYVKGRPHPRLYGTFPSLLGSIARDQRWMSLEQAVHKITARPAERFGLPDRGRLAAGCVADIVAFEADKVMGPATYEKPEQPPVGIRMVFREGRQVTPA